MAGIELKNSSYSAAVGSASSGSSMSASGPGSGSGSTASSVVESIRSAECSTQKTTSARMEFRSSTHGAPELDSEQLTRTSGCWCGALSLPFPATSLPRGRVCEAGRASELPSHPRASLASHGRGSCFDEAETTSEADACGTRKDRSFAHRHQTCKTPIRRTPPAPFPTYARARRP